MERAVTEPDDQTETCAGLESHISHKMTNYNHKKINIIIKTKCITVDADKKTG